MTEVEERWLYGVKWAPMAGEGVDDDAVLRCPSSVLDVSTVVWFPASEAKGGGGVVLFQV